MSASSATVTPPPPRACPSRAAPPEPRRLAPDPASRRLLDVELRKMFDTRAGFWLMASIGITAVLRDRARRRLRTRRRADLRHLRRRDRHPDGRDPADHRDPLGDQRVEPAQRTHHVHPGPAPQPGDRGEGRRRRARRRAWTIPVAFAVGALGNVVGPAIAGTDPVWDMIAHGVLADHRWATSSGLLMGFTLGVLIRNSAGGGRRLLRLRVRACRR